MLQVNLVFLGISKVKVLQRSKCDQLAYNSGKYSSRLPADAI